MWRRADYQGCRDHPPQMTPSATNHQAGREKGINSEGCDNSSALDSDAVPSSVWTCRRWWPAESLTPAVPEICFQPPHVSSPASGVCVVLPSWLSGGWCAIMAVALSRVQRSRSLRSSMWCFLMQMKTYSWLVERRLRLWRVENCNYDPIHTDPRAEARGSNYMWIWNLLQKEVQINGTQLSGKVRFCYC